MANFIIMDYNALIITFVAGGKGGENFNYFIFCWMAESIKIHYNSLVDFTAYSAK